jgi:quercetin dioxygenase-like cupin family protein
MSRVFDNPISGERIVIRQSAADTGGRLLAFDLFLPPGGHVPGRHVHPVQQERFTVLAGALRFRLGRRTVVAGPGEVLLVPAGTPHWFCNPGSEVAHALVEVRPALRMEEMFEATEALGLAAPPRGRRPPRISELALVLLEFRQEVAIPDLPPFLARAILALLAWWGHARRRRPTQGAAR